MVRLQVRLLGAAMMAASVDLPLLVTTALYAVGTVLFFAFFRVAQKPISEAPVPAVAK